MQMRVHRDHTIEQAGEKLSDDALAHGFARREGRILAHVAKIGRHQRQMFGAELACRGRSEHEFDQFVVGMIETAADYDLPGQSRGQTHLALAVREPVHLRKPKRHRERRSQRPALPGIVLEADDHHSSTTACGTSSARPMV